MKQCLNLLFDNFVLIGTKERLDTKALRSNSGKIQVIYLDTIESYNNENWYEELEKKFNDTYEKYKG